MERGAKFWKRVLYTLVVDITKHYEKTRVHKQLDEYGPALAIWIIVQCDLLATDPISHAVFEEQGQLRHSVHLNIREEDWSYFERGQAAFFQTLTNKLSAALTVGEDEVRVTFKYPDYDETHGNKKGQGCYFVRMLLWGQGSKTGFTFHGVTPRDCYLTHAPLITYTK